MLYLSRVLKKSLNFSSATLSLPGLSDERVCAFAFYLIQSAGVGVLGFWGMARR